MRRQKNNYILLSIIWMLAAVIIANTITESNRYYHNLFTVLNLFSYGLCFYYWLSSGCRLLSVYMFFLVYCLLSNLGQSVLYLLFVSDDFLPIYNLVTFDSLVKMLRFQYLCISGIALGTAIYVSKQWKCATLKEQQIAYVQYHIREGSIPGSLYILLYVSLGYFIFVALRLLVMRQSMTYSEIFASGRAMDQNILVSIIKYLYLFLPLYFLYKKRHTILIFSSLLFATFAFMYSGTRGLAFPTVSMMMIAAPVIKPEWFRKKYAIIWITVFILSFSLLRVISLTRNDSLKMVISNSTSISTYFLGSISEMGLSARPAVLTIDAVDNGYLSNYPTIFYTVIRAIFPFSSNISNVKEANFNLSNWISEYAESYDSGIGFSCIGELYMNFGWYAWIFTVFWGWFISYAENTAYRRLIKGKFLYAIILLVTICTLVPWARDEFQRVQNVIRYSLYIALLWALLFRKDIYKFNKKIM